MEEVFFLFNNLQIVSKNTNHIYYNIAFPPKNILIAAIILYFVFIVSSESSILYGIIYKNFLRVKLFQNLFFLKLAWIFLGEGVIFWESYFVIYGILFIFNLKFILYDNNIFVNLLKYYRINNFLNKILFYYFSNSYLKIILYSYNITEKNYEIN